MFSTVSFSTKETNVKPDDQRAERSSVFHKTVQITRSEVIFSSCWVSVPPPHGYHSQQCDLLYTDALMYSAECFKYKQSGILNEIIQTSHKEKVVQQNLQWNCDFIMLSTPEFTVAVSTKHILSCNLIILIIFRYRRKFLVQLIVALLKKSCTCPIYSTCDFCKKLAQSTYCFAFSELLLSTIKVKIDIETLQKLCDWILVCVGLLLNHFHKILQDCPSTFVGDDSCGQVSQNVRACGLDSIKIPMKE